VDGIVLDEFGNPLSYHVLNYHPGDFLHTMPLKYHVIPVADMIHWFRKDRPGQNRGLPDRALAAINYAMNAVVGTTNRELLASNICEIADGTKAVCPRCGHVVPPQGTATCCDVHGEACEKCREDAEDCGTIGGQP
jgi:hypothetical protein